MLHTNYRDVTKVLLHRESMFQTIRFILANSFALSEANVTARMVHIHRHCPTLLDALLPQSEKFEDEQKQNESRLAVSGDASHENSVALSCLDRSYVRNEMKWPLWPGHLPFNDPFCVMLQEAYDIDYQEPNVSFVRGHGLQWCQKLAFTDRYVRCLCH